VPMKTIGDPRFAGRGLTEHRRASAALPVGKRPARYNWQSGVGVKAKGGPSRCLARR
jgi:hypothetical protein